MKRIIKKIGKGIGLLLLIHIVGILGWRLLYARDLVDSPYDLDEQGQIINTWDSAMADGILTHEEIAIHYAPQIDQAVNVLLSAGGRGDFITAVNYDGDWSCLNNWENLTAGDLGAVVYYSVQETDTHYYVGYYFYHPRDDAEIWLDRHENDLEGIMLCVPKSVEKFLSPEMMYTQGHGNLYFYFGDGLLDGEKMLAGSIYGGSLTTTYLDKPHLYIAPNGTLYNQGHSVSAYGWHFSYWSVGNSGVRYFYGGEANKPLFWNGSFEDNLCSYDLRPLDELWAFRNGPYDGTGVFGSYGAFDGDNFGEDKANPPWAWRNKTAYGFGGRFLSDPVWTFSRAIAGANLSANYVDNAYADWKLVFGKASLPAHVKPEDVTLHLIRDGWEFCGKDCFTLTADGSGWYDLRLCDGRDTLLAAQPAGGAWRMEIRDRDGKVVTGAFAAVTAEYIGP